MHSIGENVGDCSRSRMLCELQLINASYSVVALKIMAIWAGAINDSDPAQIIDLNELMNQSDVSCNFVGDMGYRKVRLAARAFSLMGLFSLLPNRPPKGKVGRSNRPWDTI